VNGPNRIIFDRYSDWKIAKFAPDRPDRPFNYLIMLYQDLYMDTAKSLYTSLQQTTISAIGMN
jgi:hypothetical protein